MGEGGRRGERGQGISHYIHMCKQFFSQSLKSRKWPDVLTLGTVFLKGYMTRLLTDIHKEQKRRTKTL